MYVYACVLCCFICVWLFAALWIVAHQAPLSMGFPRQEYWSGLPFTYIYIHIHIHIYVYIYIYTFKKSFVYIHIHTWASQVALVVQFPPATEGDIRDAGSIPGSGRSPGGGHGNPFQYSCLENLMGRGVWQNIAHRVTKSWLSMHAHIHVYVYKICIYTNIS